MKAWGTYRTSWAKFEQSRPLVALLVILATGTVFYLVGCLVAFAFGRTRAFELSGLWWFLVGVIVAAAGRAYARRQTKGEKLETEI